MFDDFGGPGFDWNGNGKNDAFDHYMDMDAADGSRGGREKSTTGSKGPRSRQKKPSGGIVIYDSSKDSDGVALMKALTVCCLCLGGMVVPVTTGMGELGTILWLSSCIGLSIKVLKNT